MGHLLDFQANWHATLRSAILIGLETNRPSPSLGSRLHWCHSQKPYEHFLPRAVRLLYSQPYMIPQTDENCFLEAERTTWLSISISGMLELQNIKCGSTVCNCAQLAKQLWWSNQNYLWMIKRWEQCFPHTIKAAATAKPNLKNAHWVVFLSKQVCFETKLLYLWNL